MDDLMTTAACTLPSVERPVRLAEFDDLFATSVHRVERDGCRARLHLSGDPKLRQRVRDLAARESACCSFFDFVIEGSDGDVVLEVTVPPERADILDALARRAAELSS